MLKSSLETQRWLETAVLHSYSLVQRPDEGAVTLSRGLAEAGSECEALGRASSCRSADHGSHHRTEQMDQR